MLSLETISRILTPYKGPEGDECWIWPKARNGHGYGRRTVNGVHYSIHRLAAILWLGLDPEDERTLVLHKCDVKPCFNPKHLYLGNATQNKLDEWNHSPYCSNGHLKTSNSIGYHVGGVHCKICKKQAQAAYRDRQKRKDNNQNALS